MFHDRIFNRSCDTHRLRNVKIYIKIFKLTRGQPRVGRVMCDRVTKEGPDTKHLTLHVHEIANKRTNSIER